jgi:carbamoylphosphate synthase small subunit
MSDIDRKSFQSFAAATWNTLENGIVLSNGPGAPYMKMSAVVPMTMVGQRPGDEER